MISRHLFFLFLALSFIIHYRTDLFFFFDEWDQLSLFATSGFPSVWIPHNEHFKPLFFILYFLECKLFGLNYNFFIIINLVLHSLGTVLLYRFISRVFNSISFPRELAVLFSSFYLINYLHLENLQWAFEQCILLQIIVHLFAFNSTWEYLEKGRKIALFFAAFSCFLAPLCFGNGLILILQLFFVVVFFLMIAPETKKASNITSVVKLLGLSLFFFILVLGFYLKNKNPESSYDLLHYPVHSLKYLYVSTFLGTFLRGLSVFPVLDNQSLEVFFGGITDKKLVNFSHFGALLDLFFLVLAIRTSANKKEGIAFWLFGNLLISSSMLLPSLGRSIYHLHQGLYLRYYSLNLIGLCFVCLSVFKNYKSFTKSRLILSQVFLLFYIVIQLLEGRAFVDYQRVGRSNIAYVKDVLMSDNGREKFNNSKDSIPAKMLANEYISKMDAAYTYRALYWLDNSI